MRAPRTISSSGTRTPIRHLCKKPFTSWRSPPSLLSERTALAVPNGPRSLPQARGASAPAGTTPVRSLEVHAVSQVFKAFDVRPRVGEVRSAIAGTECDALRGAFLLFVYSLGLGISFLLLGAAIGRVLRAFELLRRHYHWIISAAHGTLACRIDPAAAAG